MHNTIQGETLIADALAALCDKDGARRTVNTFGNVFHWFKLSTPRHLTEAAEKLRDAGARLCMTTAYNSRQSGDAVQEVCYHFDIAGVVYNVTVTLDGQWPTAPSITPIFANADWHEREMMELYGIRITDQPNPHRLFLDEEMDKGLLKDIVPLSIMMNGASSADLWERILKDKGAQS